jgi:urease accessory protein
LSAQIGGRAIWTVPLAFVGLMVFGGILGMRGTPLVAVEHAIAISVVALGVSLAAARKLPQIWAMLFVSFFGLFHGHAHGTEMPHLATPYLYALGFVSSTAGIHIAGVLVGEFSRRMSKGRHLLRFIGAGIAGAGVHMLIAG